jgi:hypothetical protein
MLKKIFLGLLLVFIAIQFIRPAKNISTGPNAHDATTRYPTPAPVKQLLTVACFDCHSNNTRYPWYAEIQPVAWWLASHVRDGKNELNFSELGSYSKKTAIRRLEACMDEVTDRAMPLPSYRWTHADARLTNAQIKTLTDWFEETRDLIEEGSPPTPANSAPQPSR